MKNKTLRTTGGREIRAVSDSEQSTSTPRNAVIVKPVVNAIRILRHLSQSAEPERAVDIARHLGINPSTCFNTLRTLAVEEVIEFNKLSKRYSVGLGLMQLAEKSLSEGRRIQSAKPLMHRLAARFQVTVTLWRRLGPDRIVLVGAEANPADLRIDMSPGQRLPVLMGASGRLFAAQLEMKEPAMRAAFARLRWNRPLSFENYWREVLNGRRRGWTIDDGYFAAGIMTVAAPVFDASGALRFTVSGVLFRGQHNEAAVAQLGEALKELGARLTRILT